MDLPCFVESVLGDGGESNRCSVLMLQHEGRTLPKFGEWDVNDPASADGFTVIFNKARDEKKTGISSSSMRSQQASNCSKEKDKNEHPAKVRTSDSRLRLTHRFFSHENIVFFKALSYDLECRKSGSAACMLDWDLRIFTFRNWFVGSRFWSEYPVE